ncbi:MAG TPA: glycerol-3-phosphate 1-O-acyltransferase [Phycisphaerales bacterium]|nr:glycerol-3-phosphate 1-O-acyltransferase [Phycisphaerales bacterium]
MFNNIVAIAAAYLLGSVPFGVIIARAHGIDLRKIGSGNIGATNVARALGKKWAYTCFAFDCLKGLVPMLVFRPDGDITVASLSLWLTVGCATIAGHIFPVYLRFKGGKGMSTSLGVVLGLYPYYTMCGVIAFAVWGACVLIWKYISLASMAAAVAFPVVLLGFIIAKPAWQIATLWPLLVVALLIPALVVIRHVENIKRLLEGSESKVFQRK